MEKALAIKMLGAEGLPDNDRYTDRMKIKSETSSRLYIVARRKGTQDWECSCPGWKSHRRCKHLSAMVPLLRSAT